ncbi:lysophospholipase [Sphingobacteriaceae bacterium]|nr:lysophospholipase [Sphingobacteriaceae bacterium]
MILIKGFLYTTVSIVILVSAHFMQNSKIITYLPLGDSYTIGTGASKDEAWPALLAEHLNANKIRCKLLANPARNGFTTQDLIAIELPQVKQLNPDFVTLLIGVNDWVQGVSKASFTKNLVFILDEVERQIPDRKKLLLVTIPDFGVTRTGKNYSGGRNISDGISEFNTVIKEEGRKRHLTVVDIFEISKKMGSDNSLVAGDGLHPSAKEYAVWETIIFPEALRLLK